MNIEQSCADGSFCSRPRRGMAVLHLLGGVFAQERALNSASCEVVFMMVLFVAVALNVASIALLVMLQVSAAAALLLAEGAVSWAAFNDTGG